MGRFAGRTLLLLLPLVACDSDGLMPVPGDGDKFALDAGANTTDAMTPPPTGCVCPDLPATCTPPTTNEALFGPGRGDMQTEFVRLLACSNETLEIAMYDVDWDCVVDAVSERIEAAPNLTVQVVVDDDRCPRAPNGSLSCGLGRIESHPRVEVIDDMRSRSMHHKFVVADSRWVYASSGNLTERSFCEDLNNAIIIDTPEIVAAYSEEFSRLFNELAFGPQMPLPTVRSGMYRFYRGPESPLSQAPTWYQDLLLAIDGAEISLEIMIFAWTKTEVAEAVLRAHERGVDVRAVVSPTYDDETPALTLLMAGIPVRTAPIHSKVAIIDGRVVIGGTPNWSGNAWQNNESSLWIEHTVQAGKFQAEFERIYEVSPDP